MNVGKENTERLIGLKWKYIRASFHENQNFYKLK
jgi:hypothetical protein